MQANLRIIVRGPPLAMGEGPHDLITTESWLDCMQASSKRWRTGKSSGPHPENTCEDLRWSPWRGISPAWSYRPPFLKTKRSKTQIWTPRHLTRSTTVQYSYRHTFATHASLVWKNMLRRNIGWILDKALNFSRNMIFVFINRHLAQVLNTTVLSPYHKSQDWPRGGWTYYIS